MNYLITNKLKQVEQGVPAELDSSRAQVINNISQVEFSSCAAIATN